MTTGAPVALTASFAESTLVCHVARAVGTCARVMISLAKRFEDSMCAAAPVGPKAAKPREVSRSTNPAASGASGPTIVKSNRSHRASVTKPSRSDAGIGWHVASSAIPGFPGAQCRSIDGSSCFSFQAIACSRPPPPTIRTFTSAPRSMSGTLPRMRRARDRAHRKWSPSRPWPGHHNSPRRPRGQQTTAARTHRPAGDSRRR